VQTGFRFELPSGSRQLQSRFQSPFRSTATSVPFPIVHELLTVGRSPSEPSPTLPEFKGRDMTMHDQTGQDSPDVVLETVEEEDLGISAQARALPDLDRMLDDLSRRSNGPIRALLDVGCGMGALTGHIGRRLGIDRLIGVDCDLDRLDVAA